MHNNTSPISATTLFPDSVAAVIGAPRGFDFGESLRTSNAIRLATAFAHMNGWQLLAQDVVASKGDVYLLTGLDFLQTEPKLLYEWLRLTADGRFHPRLLTDPKAVFHPKVLIAHSSNHDDFALVGSGNLSAGGLRTNIECSVYVIDPAFVSALTNWFDALFKKGSVLTKSAIDKYKPQYDKVRKMLSTARKKQHSLEKDLLKEQEVVFKHRKEAIQEATRFFKTREAIDGHEKRLEAVKEIRQVLHFPTFSFNKAEWSDFFKIHEMGRLRMVWRDPLFKQANRVRTALGHVVDSAASETERLTSVLNKGGKHRIHGLGINIVSKVLAVHDPTYWPVYNEPVETTLKHFGYEAPHGIGEAGRYLLYAREMRNFMKDTNQPDLLFLDGFFRAYQTKLQTKH